MTQPYTTHRAAGLALLNDVPTITVKEGGFLGHVVTSPELTEKQRAWLDKLLSRNGLPPLVDGGPA
jgi:hypothetical protein